jgi:hypothetical protein
MKKVMTLAITGMIAVWVAFPADAAKKPPTQAVSGAATCTGLKSACISGTRDGCLHLGGRQDYDVLPRGPYCEQQCNFIWEQCMKTGFWEGANLHRPAERR